jgi:hypothetical protein
VKRVMEFNPQGLRKCTNYAYPPNSLHFCGPEKQLNLSEYLKTGMVDQGLMEILNKFETLYPYLLLIASSNNLKDPFDPRVVEAYWIGNDLLNNITPAKMYRHFTDVLKLPSKNTKSFLKSVNQLVSGLPFHTFHVLNIFIRTGHQASPHTLETMDNCRIGWGKVVQNMKATKGGLSECLIQTRKLKIKENLLELGKFETITVKSFNPDIKVGSQVTFHWGYVCDKVTVKQTNNLTKYTQMAISYANQQHILET